MKRQAISRKHREAILAAQNGRCWVCSDELFKVYEIDHRQALIHGGDNAPDNLRALCRSCHTAKTRIDVREKFRGERLANGPKKPKGRKMQSRGFLKVHRPMRAT